MALTVTVYTLLPAEEAQEINNLIAESYPFLFETSFLIFKARVCEGIQHEVAIEEHNIDAKSMFSIRINDKARSDKLPQVVPIFKDYYSKGNIKLLWNGEDEL